MASGRKLIRKLRILFFVLLSISLLVWMPGYSFGHPCESMTYCPDIDDSSCCYWHACTCHCCVEVARPSSISGQVEYYPDGHPEMRNFVKINTVFHKDDHVITGEDSTIIIGFSDQTTFLLKPESEIVTSIPPTRTKIGLVLGTIWVNFKHMLKGESLEVDMSQAAAGAKGTTFVLEETKSASTIKVVEGVVTVTPKRSGAPVNIKAGQMVVAKAGVLSPVGSFNIGNETARWQPLLNTASSKPPVTTTGTKPSPGSPPINLALGKPARMSSEYAGAYPASFGVDGNRNTMFHTQSEKNAWWQVDLQNSYSLKSIVLHNRESYEDRARTVHVLLSQDGNAWTTIYKHNGTNFRDLAVDSSGKPARYVRVQLAEANYLHLTEVEVFGTGAAVTQSQPVNAPIDAGTSSYSIEGPWRLQINGRWHNVEFHKSGNGWAGTMEYGPSMDPLASIQYDSRNGNISFVRPLKKYALPDQTFSGTLTAMGGQLVMRDPGREFKCIPARPDGFNPKR